MTNLVEVLLLRNIEELGEETHHCFSALTTVPGVVYIISMVMMVMVGLHIKAYKGSPTIKKSLFIWALPK